MGNVAKFREIYIRRLTERAAKEPEEYGLAPEQVPAVVDKMLIGLAKGSANVHGSPPIKATCRELGIGATIGEIKAFLTIEPNEQEDADDFRGFCKNATNDQLQAIYNKEKAAGRNGYARIAKDVAESRGMYIR